MRGIVFLLLLVPGVAFCQSGRYKIDGKTTLKFPVRIYLVYNTGAITTIDSADVKNGIFAFRGTVSNPTHGTLVLDHSGKGLMKLEAATADKLNIYLSQEDISISFTDSISKAGISGSQLNADFKELQDQLKPITVGYNIMLASFQALPPERKGSPEVQEMMFKKYKDIMAAQKKILAGYIRSNPAKFTSLDALKDYGGEEADAPQIEELYNSLAPEIKKTKSAADYYAIIKKSAITAIGAIAPDFTQPNPDGVPVTLSSFRGKYVLIDFWASWCGPCRQENPNVVSVYNQYKDKNFTILGVSLDRSDGKNAWIKAIKDDDLVWTQVSDLKFWQNEAAVKYGIMAIPKNLLLDPEGRIIAKNIRGEELRTTLAKTLK